MPSVGVHSDVGVLVLAARSAILGVLCIVLVRRVTSLAELWSDRRVGAVACLAVATAFWALAGLVGALAYLNLAPVDDLFSWRVALSASGNAAGMYAAVLLIKRAQGEGVQVNRLIPWIWPLPIVFGALVGWNLHSPLAVGVEVLHSFLKAFILVFAINLREYKPLFRRRRLLAANAALVFTALLQILYLFENQERHILADSLSLCTATLLLYGLSDFASDDSKFQESNVNERPAERPRPQFISKWSALMARPQVQTFLAGGAQLLINMAQLLAFMTGVRVLGSFNPDESESGNRAAPWNAATVSLALSTPSPTGISSLAIEDGSNGPIAKPATPWQSLQAGHGTPRHRIEDSPKKDEDLGKLGNDGVLDQNEAWAIVAAENTTAERLAVALEALLSSDSDVDVEELSVWIAHELGRRRDLPARHELIVQAAESVMPTSGTSRKLLAAALLTEAKESLRPGALGPSEDLAASSLRKYVSLAGAGSLPELSPFLADSNSWRIVQLTLQCVQNILEADYRATASVPTELAENVIDWLNHYLEPKSLVSPHGGSLCANAFLAHILITSGDVVPVARRLRSLGRPGATTLAINSLRRIGHHWKSQGSADCDRIDRALSELTSANV